MTVKNRKKKHKFEKDKKTSRLKDLKLFPDMNKHLRNVKVKFLA